jgi:hypothetical protein
MEVALAAGVGAVFVAEFAGVTRGLSLDDGIGVRVVMRGCHELVLPVEKLVLALARHPCTSLSALQAR